jgi:hypothetical protein
VFGYESEDEMWRKEGMGGRADGVQEVERQQETNGEEQVDGGSIALEKKRIVRYWYASVRWRRMSYGIIQ